MRTISLWLLGFGQTRFLSASACRDGRTEALAQDALDLMDALGIKTFSVIGHDWGARTAYALAAIAPERIETITALLSAIRPAARFLATVRASAGLVVSMVHVGLIVAPKPSPKIRRASPPPVGNLEPPGLVR